MLADVVPYLRCPVCGTGLSAAGQALRCAHGHSFDAARQGYVQLSAGRVVHAGDSPAMVDARTNFLGRGHYDFISTALARAAAGGTGLVLDAGAGTGYHLGVVLDSGPDLVGLALDASRAALGRAVRAHSRIGAVRCDTWQPLPVLAGQVGVLLNVFAPRNAAEFARVLRPDGRLLVVTPTGEHLTELVSALGLLQVDPAKEERVADRLGGQFTPLDEEVLVAELALDHGEVGALVGMGPSAWHADADKLAAAIDGLREPVRVTASVRLARYKPGG
jgi:23S rRNA (guanine745-N1)-methyltransferase